MIQSLIHLGPSKLNIIERLEKIEIKDLDFNSQMDNGVTSILNRLMYSSNLCKRLVVLLYEIRILNMKKGLEFSIYDQNQVQSIREGVHLLTIQCLRQRVQFNFIKESELFAKMTELNLENSQIVAQNANAAKCYYYIKLVYMLKYNKSFVNPDCTKEQFDEEFKNGLNTIVQRIIRDVNNDFAPDYKSIILKEFYEMAMEFYRAKQDLKHEVEYSKKVMNIAAELSRSSPAYGPIYKQIAETHNKLKEKLENIETRQNIITYGSIFLGIVGITTIASYFLFKNDKKD